MLGPHADAGIRRNLIFRVLWNCFQRSLAQMQQGGKTLRMILRFIDCVAVQSTFICKNSLSSVVVGRHRFFITDCLTSRANITLRLHRNEHKTQLQQRPPNSNKIILEHPTPMRLYSHHFPPKFRHLFCPSNRQSPPTQPHAGR